MGASNRSILQAVLAADYESLVRRLTRTFGCADFASETLHDTFARLDRIPDTTEVHSPKDYLVRTAINIGKNRRRAERYRATAAEIEEMLSVADETPSPAQAVEAQSDMESLRLVLTELPPRVRKVFEAALFDNVPYPEISQSLGVSLRTVERDIQQAIEHCARRLGRNLMRRPSGPRRRA
ncbi:RNA polymerase sigma factor [Bradyrhizobium sp. LHD-71]|uniref:RNA polymerase sigma factor n=1 Tax=Bradyrhizobium sp. LHD-71 TaxID=3072141 RepID=UPI00280EA10E|nr:RNA polymerase sigma factor [Bradyrhizobium sp. LHD-71]MDQ8728095.1 RNA polymerase sigma factor [Bradyrhizobium sp. LHD-71]